jgi:hypothetical protein
MNPGLCDDSLVTKCLGHGMANFVLLLDHGKKNHFPKFAFLTEMK